MKKLVLSCLAAAIVFAVSSSLSFAASSTSDAWKKNTGVITLGTKTSYTGSGISVNGSVVNITAGGSYTITGTLSNGMINVKTSDAVELQLSGADITNSSGPAIFIDSASKAYIVLKDGTSNKLTDGSKYTVDAKSTLFSNDPLEISGNGSLSITGNYKHGIASDDDLVIQSGAITVNSAVDGLHANDNITVNGGTINITSASDGLESESDMIINNGIVTVSAGDDGLHAESDLKINGGTVNILKSYEGIESKSTLIINGGTVRLKASDDGLNAGTLIEINGGYIYVECDGDGYDSNGNLTLNGGTSIVYSGGNMDSPLDTGDRGATCLINGGTHILSGGSMSVSISSNSTQYSMYINGSVQSDKLVNISEQNGSSIATIAPAKNCSLIFYSSDKLAANKTYVVSTGGASTGKATDGVYTGGTYSGGTQVGTVAMSAKNVSVGQAMGMGGFGGKGSNRMPNGTTVPGSPNGSTVPGGAVPPNQPDVNNGQTGQRTF